MDYLPLGFKGFVCCRPNSAFRNVNKLMYIGEGEVGPVLS